MQLHILREQAEQRQDWSLGFRVDVAGF